MGLDTHMILEAVPAPHSKHSDGHQGINQTSRHYAEALRWEAFVTAVLAAGPAYERRSRYGDKPALFIEGREMPTWKRLV